eukprot:TRINITY_DN1826_c0_g1_i4.p1 TRINITY_DN1826_c0_g1~~TRINITY_DN1826_c0_g1_i4.p1  ORF type:complete len:237 (+),score=10.25 TRINITY_DN1826_c0_g1_i4:121-831(+)
MRKWQIIMAVLCWLCVRGHASRVVIEELPLTKQHSFGVKKCKAYSLPANYKIVKLKVEILLDGFVMVTDKKLTSLSKEAISKCQDDMIVCAIAQDRSSVIEMISRICVDKLYVYACSEEDHQTLALNVEGYYMSGSCGHVAETLPVYCASRTKDECINFRSCNGLCKWVNCKTGSSYLMGACIPANEPEITAFSMCSGHSSIFDPDNAFNFTRRLCEIILHFTNNRLLSKQRDKEL